MVPLRRSIALVVFAVSGLLLSSNSQSVGTTKAPEANYIHGTTVVVVSTKGGFVLASESRGSDSNCRPLPGDFQKVFPLGGHGALVVAGMIGASDLTNELGESLSTQLRFRDGMAHADYIEATSIAQVFLDSLGREAGLLDFGLAGGGLVSAASAVSISKAGKPEWLSLIAQPFVRAPGTRYESWGVKVEQFIDPPASRVLALGSGEPIVDALMEKAEPTPDDPASQTETMGRYYALRRSGKLSDLTLDDGRAIAQLAIETAINFASSHPETCFGIGGPIRILTVTTQGVSWIVPPDPSRLARSTPLYHGRVSDSDMYGRLDGVEWFRGTVPANGVLLFEGKGCVRMVQPKFKGPCTFVLAEGAERRMPDVAAMLKAKFQQPCDIVRQTSSGQTKLSSATSPVVSSVSPVDDKASLSNSEIRVIAIQLASKLKAFVDSEMASYNALDEVWTPFDPSRIEEQNVAYFKKSVRAGEKFDDLLSGYRTEFEDPLYNVERELARRIADPSKADYYDPRGIVTDMEMYQVIKDILRLASVLPCPGCPTAAAPPQ